MSRAEVLALAASETARLCEQLDITNADHIALWLEANRDAGLPWLAVQIVEAHEAALRALAERMTDED